MSSCIFRFMNTVIKELHIDNVSSYITFMNVTFYKMSNCFVTQMFLCLYDIYCDNYVL